MTKVLMCGSTLATKGGMVSVVKNYLSYGKWGEYKITYVPTHLITNKYLLLFYFGIKYLYILLLCFFGNYQIAHLHTAERGSFWRKRFLLKTFHKFGIKVILHHHAAEFEEFYTNCPDPQKLKIQETLKEADVNLVLSKKLIPMILTKQPDACVRVLYNAVTFCFDNPYNIDACNVLFLGRLGQRKGTFDLLEAIKRLDERIPGNVLFYLCGDVGEDETWEKIKSLGIEHRIAHVGWIDGSQKKNFFKNTMINCLPSYNEGLPMTILETMAAGIPNISTNIASIPEVLHDGENGFLIEPGDVENLTKKLEMLILDADLRKKFSEASYELISKRFSLDSNIEELKKIYTDLCG